MNIKKNTKGVTKIFTFYAGAAAQPDFPPSQACTF
jgi:hypothetical protein